MAAPAPPETPSMSAAEGAMTTRWRKALSPGERGCGHGRRPEAGCGRSPALPARGGWGGRVEAGEAGRCGHAHSGAHAHKYTNTKPAKVRAQLGWW